MDFKPIQTKTEYRIALKRFSKVFLAETGTKESDEADVLSIIVKEYEDKHFIIDTPSPEELRKYRLEKSGKKSR